MNPAATLEQIDAEQAAAFRARHPGVQLGRVGSVWLAHVQMGNGSGYTTGGENLGAVIDTVEAFLRELRGG
jgi:hypothetical protein